MCDTPSLGPDDIDLRQSVQALAFFQDAEHELHRIARTMESLAVAGSGGPLSDRQQRAQAIRRAALEAIGKLRDDYAATCKSAKGLLDKVQARHAKEPVLDPVVAQANSLRADLEHAEVVIEVLVAIAVGECDGSMNPAQRVGLGWALAALDRSSPAELRRIAAESVSDTPKRLRWQLGGTQAVGTKHHGHTGTTRVEQARIASATAG